MFGFIIVITALYFLQCILIICSDFKASTVTRKMRKTQFFVGLFFAGWGFILILQHFIVAKANSL